MDRVSFYEAEAAKFSLAALQIKLNEADLSVKSLKEAHRLAFDHLDIMEVINRTHRAKIEKLGPESAALALKVDEAQAKFEAASAAHAVSGTAADALVAHLAEEELLAAKTQLFPEVTKILLIRVDIEKQDPKIEEAEKKSTASRIAFEEAKATFDKLADEYEAKKTQCAQQWPDITNFSEFPSAFANTPLHIDKLFERITTVEEEAARVRVLRQEAEEKAARAQALHQEAAAKIHAPTSPQLAQLSAANQSLRKHNQAITNEIERLRQSLRQLKHEKELSVQKANRLAGDLSNANVKLSEAMETADELANTKAELEQKNHELQASCETLVSNLTEYTTEVDILSNDKEHLSVELIETQSLVNTLTEQVKELSRYDEPLAEGESFDVINKVKEWHSASQLLVRKNSRSGTAQSPSSTPTKSTPTRRSREKSEGAESRFSILSEENKALKLQLEDAASAAKAAEEKENALKIKIEEALKAAEEKDNALKIKIEDADENEYALKIQIEDAVKAAEELKLKVEKTEGVVSLSSTTAAKFQQENDALKLQVERMTPLAEVGLQVRARRLEQSSPRYVQRSDVIKKGLTAAFDGRAVADATLFLDSKNKYKAGISADFEKMYGANPAFVWTNRNFSMLIEYFGWRFAIKADSHKFSAAVAKKFGDDSLKFLAKILKHPFIKTNEELKADAETFAHYKMLKEAYTTSMKAWEETRVAGNRLPKKA